MPDREELIDLAIEAYIDGLDHEGLVDFVRGSLEDYYANADSDTIEDFVEATGVRENA